MFLAAQAAVAAAAVGYSVGPMLTQTLSIDGKKCGQRPQRRGLKTVSYLCLFIGRGPDTRVLFLVSVRLIMILQLKRKEYGSY